MNACPFVCAARAAIKEFLVYFTREFFPIAAGPVSRIRKYQPLCLLMKNYNNPLSRGQE